MPVEGHIEGYPTDAQSAKCVHVPVDFTCELIPQMDMLQAVRELEPTFLGRENDLDTVESANHSTILLVTADPALRHSVFSSMTRYYPCESISPEQSQSLSEGERADLAKMACALLVEWSEENLLSLLVFRAPCAGSRTPIFVIGPLSEADKIAALKIGADDCLECPINPCMFDAKLSACKRRYDEKIPTNGEVYARIEKEDRTPSLSLRLTAEQERENEDSAIEAMRLDCEHHILYADGAALSLRSKEFQIMEMLMRDPGACFRRATLLDKIWGVQFDSGTNILDVQVYELRKKRKEAGIEVVIETVRGVGYRLMQQARHASLA